MNKIAFIALIALLVASCKKEEAKDVQPVANPAVDINQPMVHHVDTTTAAAVPVENQTEMTFTEKEHDFGTINQGDKPMHIFKFTNTGTKDLVITNAVGSCGCTVPEYPKEPVGPGKTGTMKVSFNSTGKTGNQAKTVTISANVPNGATVLTIKANVKPK